MVLNLRNKTLGCFATLIFILISIASVSAIPLTPMSIQGDVTINGNPAPAGTVVMAKIDGVAADTYTVQSTGQYMLTIGGESSDAGKTIEIFVNGDKIDTTQNWESGAIVTIDLSVSSSNSGSEQKSSSSSSSYFTSDSANTSDNNSGVEESSTDISYEPAIDEQEVISDNVQGSSEIEENSSPSKSIPGFTSVTLIVGLIVLCIRANRKKKE